MTVLALAGLRRLYRANTGSGLAVRFAIVFVFFPLALYFSHPETYYFRPVDPLIVVLAAYFVTERFGRPRKSTLLSSGDQPSRVVASCQAFEHLKRVIL